MERVKVRNNIRIERNPIEQFLMKMQDFIRRKRTIVLYSLLGVMFVALLAIAASVYLEKRAHSLLVSYETIMDDYQKAGKEKPENIASTIGRLAALHEKAGFGFVYEMSQYSIGNLLFLQGKYDDAGKALTEFAGKTSSDMYAAAALLKAASAAEEKGDLDGALALYSNLEKGYINGVYADQIMYNMGRVYNLKGDAFLSRKYYNMVISTYPRSSLAGKAKKRLFLVGINSGSGAANK